MRHLGPALARTLAQAADPECEPVVIVMWRPDSFSGVAIGPFATPEQARQWWDQPFSRLRAVCEFVLLPLAPLLPTPPVSHCKSCSAPVVFATTERGKTQILDAQPCESGTVQLSHVGGRWRARVAGQGDLLGGGDGPRYLDHHVSCPDERLWRDKRSRNADAAHTAARLLAGGGDG